MHYATSKLPCCIAIHKIFIFPRGTKFNVGIFLNFWGDGSGARNPTHFFWQLSFSCHIPPFGGILELQLHRFHFPMYVICSGIGLGFGVVMQDILGVQISSGGVQ